MPILATWATLEHLNLKLIRFSYTLDTAIHIIVGEAPEISISLCALAVWQKFSNYDQIAHNCYNQRNTQISKLHTLCKQIITEENRLGLRFERDEMAPLTLTALLSWAPVKCVRRCRYLDTFSHTSAQLNHHIRATAGICTMIITSTYEAQTESSQNLYICFSNSHI